MATDRNSQMQGKTELIHDGDSGIGKATALLLSQYGADIIILDKNDARDCVGMIERLGRRAQSIVYDLSKPNELPALIEQNMLKNGPVDILVNCAGIID